MRKRTTASTILISLAAVGGCNSGDGDYVTYNQTTPSEFEENQKQSGPPVHDAATVDMPEVDSKSPARQDVVSPESSVAEDSATGIKSIFSTQSGLTGRADTPEIDNAAAKSANKIELLIPDKSFRRERGTDAVRVSYDDIDLLKILNMEPVPPNAAEYFPEWLASLNGKHIRIRGWMYPTFVSEGLTSFTLARDNGICCFTKMPKIYDVIFVKLEGGQTSRYIDQRPFDVEGTFRIDNESDGSELPRLYKIENARVLD